MFVVRTVKDPADPICQFVSGEQPIRLYHLALGVYPLGLYRIEPRTLGGEVLSNVVDWPLWSRGDLLPVSFYQLPIPELGSGSYQRHQMMSV